MWKPFLKAAEPLLKMCYHAQLEPTENIRQLGLVLSDGKSEPAANDQTVRSRSEKRFPEAAKIVVMNYADDGSVNTA